MKTATIAALFVVLLVVVAAAGYYELEVAPQPNLQITALVTSTPVQDNQDLTVLNQGLVSGSGSFSYTANLTGSYYLTFGNAFSVFSSKNVAVTYTVAGKQYNTGVSVGAGATQTIFVGLAPGEQVTGSYTVSGGSGNDADFSIVGDTCTETIPFTFTIVNSGPVGGYATVAYQSDGTSIWTNKYYVPAGQQLPVTGSGNLLDCNNHAFTAAVTSQQKG